MHSSSDIRLLSGAQVTEMSVPLSKKLFIVTVFAESVGVKLTTLTVKLALAAFVSADFAVMTAEPTPFTLTSPAALTVTTLALLDVHLTALAESAGVLSAVY